MSSNQIIGLLDDQLFFPGIDEVNENYLLNLMYLR